MLKALGQLPLTKYCDYNLVNIVTQNKAKPTLEVRNLPATLDSVILAVASVIESLLMLVCSEDSAQTQERLWPHRDRWSPCWPWLKPLQQ